MWVKAKTTTLNIYAKGGAIDRATARKNAVSSVQRFIELQQKKYEAGAASLKSGRHERRVIDAVIYGARLQGHLTLANHIVRVAAQVALIDELLETFAREAPDYRLLTLIWDDGMTNEADPQVDIPKMVDQVKLALQVVGVEALCVIEVDALSRRVDGEQTRRLMFHAHAVCWQPGGEFKPRKKAAAIIEAVSSLRNAWAVEPAVFTWRERNWQSVAGLGVYLLKANSGVKKLVPHRARGHNVLRHAPYAEYSPALAVRLTEIQSRCSVDDLIFPVGEAGARFHERWRKRFVEALSKRKGLIREIDRTEVERAWSRVYMRTLSGPCRRYALGALGL